MPSLSSRRYRGAQVVEGPQNMVAALRMLNTCQVIERAKRRAMTKINHERAILAAQYNEFLTANATKDESSTCDCDTSTALLSPVGFRFHNNGDLKRHSCTVTAVDCNRRMDKSSATCSNKAMGDTSQETKMEGGANKPTRSRNIQDFPKLNVMLMSMRKSLVQNKAFGPADSLKSRDHKMQHHYGYDLKMPSQSSHNQEKGTVKKPTSDRFNRTCSKSNCVACQQKLKFDPDESPLKFRPKPVKHSRSAPKGSFMRLLDESNNCQISRSLNFGPTTQSMMSTVSVPEAITRAAKSAPAISSIDNDSRRDRPSKGNVYTEDKYRYMMAVDPITDRKRGEMLKTLYQDKDVEESEAVTASGRERLSRSNTSAKRSSSLVALKINMLKGTTLSSTKISEFLATLPSEKPSITRWRSSTGSNVKHPETSGLPGI